MDETNLNSQSSLALLDTELHTGVQNLLASMAHYMQIRYQIRLRGPLALAALKGIDAPNLGRETLKIVDTELHHPVRAVLSVFIEKYDRYVRSLTVANTAELTEGVDPAYAKYKEVVLSNSATLRVYIQDLVIKTGQLLQANTAGQGFEPESELESTYLQVGGIVAGDLGWIILEGIDALKEAVECAGRLKDRP